MAASYDGHVDIVRILVGAKANLNIQEPEVFIPYHCNTMEISIICSMAPLHFTLLLKKAELML